LNALGALIGFGLFRLFAKIFQKTKRGLKITPQGIFAYVDNVVAQVSAEGHSIPEKKA